MSALNEKAELTSGAACFTHASVRLKSIIRDQIAANLGDESPSAIVLKPNWVVHETDPAFPISALVTDARVIEATIEACLEIFPNAKSILVGDCPLQYADWPQLCQQSGIQALIDRWPKRTNGKVLFRDLRRDVFQRDGAALVPANGLEHGDPLGYREIELGASSHLEPISDQARRFAVNDYSAEVTRSNHRRGSHRYLVCQSILEADLVLNLAKWKSHQKSCITGALKNLVGINGDKAYLPHFRRGAPKWGGDEFRDENRWLYFAQTRLRERFQKRSPLAFKLLKPGWEVLKKLRGIETRLPDRAAAPKNFYIAGGAWHGNETIWRMIYDLNFLIRFADPQGKIQPNPQRQVFSIVDGLVCGEGNGPLQPLPRPLDWLVCGGDPFAIDAALSCFMGFDPEKIPLLAHRCESMKGFDLVATAQGKQEQASTADSLSNLRVTVDGEVVAPMDSEINFHFAPPPGWRNYVER